MRQPDSHTGLTEEGHDDAVAGDSLDLAFNAGKRATDDSHGLPLLVNEVVVCQGDTLTGGIRTGGGIDEVLHLTVGHPDDLGAVGLDTGLHNHELHHVAAGRESLQQLQLDLHRVDKDDVIDGTKVSVLTGIAKIVFRRLLKMKIGLIALGMKSVVDFDGTLLTAIADTHGVPAEIVVVFLFQDAGIVALVALEIEASLLGQE